MCASEMPSFRGMSNPQFIWRPFLAKAKACKTLCRKEVGTEYRRNSADTPKYGPAYYSCFHCSQMASVPVGSLFVDQFKSQSANLRVFTGCLRVEVILPQLNLHTTLVFFNTCLFAIAALSNGSDEKSPLWHTNWTHQRSVGKRTTESSKLGHIAYEYGDAFSWKRLPHKQEPCNHSTV